MCRWKHIDKPVRQSGLSLQSPAALGLGVVMPGRGRVPAHAVRAAAAAAVGRRDAPEGGSVKTLADERMMAPSHPDLGDGFKANE